MIDLKDFIKEKNLSQRKFSDLTGVDYNQLSKYVNGKATLNQLDIDRIRKIFPDFESTKTTIPKYTNGVESIKLSMRNVPLVTRFAYASFIEHYNDQEYIDTLETIPTTESEDGVYYWFEIKGDSMSRMEDPSLNERDQILCRELYPHHWTPLQLSRDLVWVINHTEMGLIVKEIIKQQGATLVCHSWNPLVPDFEINLSDVRQIFYFRELRKKRLKSYF